MCIFHHNLTRYWGTISKTCDALGTFSSARGLAIWGFGHEACFEIPCNLLPRTANMEIKFDERAQVQNNEQ